MANRKGDLIMTLPNGYEMTTTFMSDFDIADIFGENAIKDTFKRAFDEWKENYVYLTELVISLNLHIWSGMKRTKLLLDCTMIYGSRQIHMLVKILKAKN